MSAIAPAHFIFNMEIDVVDVGLEKFVKKQIARELSPSFRWDRLDEIFTVLTRPICLSYVNKMDMAINRLAWSKDFSQSALRRVYGKFWWTNLGWENMQPYSLKDFLDLIKRRSKLKDLKSRLDHAEDFIKNNQQERLLYLKKFNLSPAVKYWLDICDKYIFYHDKRKELQVISTYSARLVLREIARRYKLKMDDLEWLWHFEVLDILRDKPVDQAEIMARKKCIAALVSYQSFKSWSGLAAQKIKDRHVPENAAQVRKLKGRGVEGGLIRARVKVCAGTVEALAKVKRGDILVCPMTLPDYLPAMKRARAIITEEGGVTCHAAIIAREFKIPCIVGTKIATEVLRDGDLVEMDPGTGVIKILS
jgi:phosphohistidine swiveling domain-containing protein